MCMRDRGPKWDEALGAFSGSERGEALDLLGFRRQVVFSSFCARLIFETEPLGVRYEIAGAHNRAMAEFCDHDDRLLGVAMVPLDDPARALAEIEAADELGLAAVWIASDAPGGRSPGLFNHKPIWPPLPKRLRPLILPVGTPPLTVEVPGLNAGPPQNRSLIPIRRCRRTPNLKPCRSTCIY